MMKVPGKSAECHLVVRVHSNPQDQERVKMLLLDRVEPIRSEAGCLYYNLLQQAESVSTFVILTGWTDHESLALHQSRPDSLGMVERLMPLLQSTNPIESIQMLRLSENLV
jgi:quinol monooxygenase YgiN